MNSSDEIERASEETSMHALMRRAAQEERAGPRLCSTCVYGYTRAVRCTYVYKSVYVEGREDRISRTS